MENDHEPEMLSQPLTTEDGALNPACMNELEAAIAGMGKTHERLASDDEWSATKDRWTFRSDIVGAFAMWACRQSPYGVPDGLENVCKYLNAALKTAFKWDTAGMQEISLCDINKALHEILMDQGVAEFDAWNRCKKGETPEINFVSAYDGPTDPDLDFIDLDALLHNVCMTIRDERRKNKAFDDDFEARHASVPLPPNP
jgi:hypothetical protein